MEVGQATGEGTHKVAVRKVCKNCNKEYEAKVTWQKFCSEACRLEWHDFHPQVLKKKVG